MDETKLAKLVRLSAKATAKTLATLERRAMMFVENYLPRSFEFRAGRFHRS